MLFKIVHNKNSYLIFCFEKTKENSLSLTFDAEKKNVNAKTISRCLNKIIKNDSSNPIRNIFISQNFNKNSVQKSVNKIIDEFNQNRSEKIKIPFVEVLDEKLFQEEMKRKLYDFYLEINVKMNGKNTLFQGTLFDILNRQGQEQKQG